MGRVVALALIWTFGLLTFHYVARPEIEKTGKVWEDLAITVREFND